MAMKKKVLGGGGEYSGMSILFTEVLALPFFTAKCVLLQSVSSLEIFTITLCPRGYVFNAFCINATCPSVDRVGGITWT